MAEKDRKMQQKRGIFMPTTYAHYKFGKEVISALPRPLQNSIENNRELFDIGVHGPDLLFYYKALMKNPVNTQGYELHDKMSDEFFRNAVEVIKKSRGSGCGKSLYIWLYLSFCTGQ